MNVNGINWMEPEVSENSLRGITPFIALKIILKRKYKFVISNGCEINIKILKKSLNIVNTAEPA